MQKAVTSSESIAARLILDGSWDTAAMAAATDARILVLAASERISVAPEQVQVAVDKFREREGLHDETATLGWLDAFGLSLEQLVEFCKIQLLRSTMLESFSHGEVFSWFSEREENYSATSLSVLSFLHESDAWLVHNESKTLDFNELVWQRRQADSTLPLGSHLGWVFLKQLPPNVATLVLKCAAEQCTTPLLVDGSFRVYYVWRKRSAKLNSVTEWEVRNDMLLEKLQQINLTDS